MTETEKFRSGFVALVGQPNVGKSTLLNAYLETHISIITPKPQTTRNNIRGIYTIAQRGQIIFVDTPGIHHWEKKKLNHFMVQSAIHAMEDADLVVYLLDVRQALDKEGEIPRAEQWVLDKIKSVQTPVILAINKIDLLKNPSHLLPIIDSYQKAHHFELILPISALQRAQLDVLREEMLKRLPEGPMLYPEDIVSDQAEKFFAAELIREQITLLTRKEIPYSVAVQIEHFEETEKLLKLNAVIHVERKSQKGILIGKKGTMIKKIGALSRKALERFFGKKVYLQTFVRVQEDWSKDPKALERLGYGRD